MEKGHKRKGKESFFSDTCIECDFEFNVIGLHILKKLLQSFANFEQIRKPLIVCESYFLCSIEKSYEISERSVRIFKVKI
jgi:hypothetical protein